MREYKILTDTAVADLEVKIRDANKRFKNVQVHGSIGWDGTNYIALISYEV